MTPMRELPDPRQPVRPRPPRGFRRIFANHEFTLHVWFDQPAGRITEFHIFAGVLRSARVSWTSRHGLRTGRATERGHWGADGVRLPLTFDYESFRKAMAHVDPTVRDFVLSRLKPTTRGRSPLGGGIRTHMAD